MSYSDQEIFPGIGRCIYCPATDDLSDEHIIPFSLAGRHIFKDASCGSCRNITTKFEQLCARNIYGPLRYTQKYPTRRKRERPTHLEVQIEFEGRKERRMVPVDDYPASPVVSPIFPIAGIRIGGRSPQDEQNEIDNIHYMVVMPVLPDQNDRLQRLRKNGSTAFAIEVRFGLNPFTRLLAKIAHGFAVALYGIDSFRPLLPDYILDRNLHLLHVIGGTSTEIPLLQPDIDFRYAIHVGFRKIDGKHYVSVLVQLFRYLHLPVYEVIAGEASQGLVQRAKDEHRAGAAT